jgi:hypothetical protein
MMPVLSPFFLGLFVLRRLRDYLTLLVCRRLYLPVLRLLLACLLLLYLWWIERLCLKVLRLWTALVVRCVSAP